MGRTLGEYELLEQIGSGGMGSVFRARKRGSEHVVALKLGPRTDDPARLERFRREGQITAGLRHPHIVAVHDAGVAERHPYLACHLVEGARTLDQVLPGWELRARVSALRDVARALGHAHTRGIVHRDVKPQNVLVDREGSALLADFGLASALDLERMTRSNVLLGTPLYMAPEQVSASHLVGPPVDVYSLGVILYEALVGEHPYAHRGLEAVLDARARRFSTPHARDPAVSDALSRVCMRCLAADPASRYAHGDDLADALDAWLAGEAAPRSRAPLGLAALLVVATGAAVAWALQAEAAPPTAPPPALEGEHEAPVTDAPPRPPDPPTPEPLTPSEAAAFARARALLEQPEPDERQLQAVLSSLSGALHPADAEHAALVDAVVARLRVPERVWADGGLDLLRALAETGGRPRARDEAEQLAQSLFWAARYGRDLTWGQALTGFVSMVQLDLNVYGAYVVFERTEQVDDLPPESLEQRYLRELSLVERAVELGRPVGTAELLALAESPQLGPVCRARALNAVASSLPTPASRLELVERAWALDPESITIEFALAQGRLATEGEPALPAHAAAWERWYREKRDRDGANQLELELIRRSLPPLIRLERYAEALSLLESFDQRWPRHGHVRQLRRRVLRFQAGEEKPADDDWLQDQ